MFDLKANARDMGRRIAALRSRAGQNQADLAAAVGKSRTFITDIETGSNTPGIETAIGIAEEFKVPLDWLLGRKVPCDGPLAGHFVDDLDKLALLSWWGKLNDTERASALRLLNIQTTPERLAG